MGSAQDISSDSAKKTKLRRALPYLIGVLLAAGVCLLIFLLSGKQEEPEPEITTTATTTTVTTTTTTVVTTTTTAETLPRMEKDSGTEPYLTAAKAAELRANADAMAAKYPDFVGWLYLADSQIDYPVMQGEDNEVYLHATVDRVYDRLGTLYIDFRNDRHFSDPVTIFFGHNMASGKMFGNIRTFRSQSAFSAHKYGWLFTPDTVYRIDFFALAVLNAYDTLYNLPNTLDYYLERMYENVHFRSDIELGEDDRVVALSTCASDYEDARAIFTGKLVEMLEDSDYIR